MDVDALRTFVSVHRHGGISAAARTLHRTQPAISRRLAVLEESLGVPLFERGAQRVIPTPAGRWLLPFAERALAAIQDVETAARGVTAGDAGDVKLAVVGTLADARLGSVLRRLRDLRPQITVDLTTGTSRQVSRAVAGGESEIGVRYESDRSTELKSVAIAAETMVVICL